MDEWASSPLLLRLLVFSKSTMVNILNKIIIPFSSVSIGSAFSGDDYR